MIARCHHEIKARPSSLCHMTDVQNTCDNISMGDSHITTITMIENNQMCEGGERGREREREGERERERERERKQERGEKKCTCLVAMTQTLTVRQYVHRPNYA